MSKKYFNDGAFRELSPEIHVGSQRVAGSIATTRDAPFISPKDLKSWVIE